MNIKDIKDKLAFWRWPVMVDSLSDELTELKAEHAALKAEHERVVAGQIKLLEWVKTTHRLHRAPEGIRALIQEGKRLVPVMALMLFVQCLWSQPAPPIQRNPFTTNQHFGPVPSEGQVPIWNATAKKWSNNIIVGGGVSFADIHWTNQPPGRLRPTYFTNWVEVQRPITIGTNSITLAGGIASNDIIIAYRDLTKDGDGGWSPRYEIGAISNGVASTLYYDFPHRGAGLNLTSTDENGNSSFAKIYARSETGPGGDPEISIFTTNGYIPFASQRATNTIINNVTYRFPTVQGAAGTILTNDGTGTLGWGIDQSGSGGSGITNLFSPTLSNATIKPLVVGVGDAAGATNTTGEIRGIEAGSGITLTPNGSNYVITATGGGVGFADLIWTNNGTTILPASAYVYSSNRLHFGSPTTTGPRTNKLEWIPLTNSLRIGSVADINSTIKYTPTISNYWDFPFNNAANTYGFGSNTLIQSVNSSILGGANNAILSNSASSVIVGGTNNLISTNNWWSFIGGGNNNQIHISSPRSTIVGGLDNDIETISDGSFIGGGQDNSIGAIAGVGALQGTIAGGLRNKIRGGPGNFVGGGEDNVIITGSDNSSVVGGDGNQIGLVTTGADYSFIGGGLGNGIDNDAHYSMVGGGQHSRIFGSSPHSAILGGITNSIGDTSGGSFVIGSYNKVDNAVTNGFIIGIRQTNTVPHTILIGMDTASTNNLRISQTNLHLHGDLTILMTNGAGAGKVLTSDANGKGTWQAAAAGGSGISNLFSPTLSNATIKPLVVGVGDAAGATNTTGEIRGIEAGANITITPNGSNYVIASSAGTIGGTNVFEFINLSVQAAKLPSTNYPYIDAGWQNWETVYAETNAEGARANLASSWQFMVPPDYTSNSMSVLLNYSLVGTNGPNTSNVIWGVSVLPIRSGTTNNIHTNLFGATVYGTNDWIAKYDGTNITTNIVIDLGTNSALSLVDLALVKIERFALDDTYGGAVALQGIQIQYTGTNQINLGGGGGGGSGITNLFSLSLSNATLKPIVFGGVGNAAAMTNSTGQLYGLEAGGNVTITPNGSNLVITATVSGSGISTNGNQFGPSVELTIKDGAFLTNLNVETSLQVSNGHTYLAGPVTNLTQLNLPHLTVSRSAIINAQGDLTNSSADANWSLYPTNVWNDRQFGSANLTNWSNIPTGAMANVVSVTFLTNWANAISNYVTAATNSASVTNWITTRQPSSLNLTNLSGTGAITNVFSASLSNATMKPVVFPSANNFATNYTGMFFGLEAGGNVTLTPNGSNIVIAASVSGSGITTNGNQFGPSVELTIKDTALFTNALHRGAGFIGAVTNNLIAPQFLGTNVVFDGSISSWFQFNPATGPETNYVFTNIQAGQTIRLATFVTNGTTVRLWANTTEIPASWYVGNNGNAGNLNSNAPSVVLVSRDPLIPATNVIIQTRDFDVVAGGNVTFTTNFVAGTVSIAASVSGSGISTNANQFGASVELTLKDGAFLTNLNVQSSLQVSNGHTYLAGPVTNLIQLNLPHLTVSRSAVINAQGDVTNSSADANWSLYPTNVWNDRQGGSLVLSNIVGTGALTNANAFQPASLILTNLAGTGAITNLFSPTLSNATIKPLVVGVGNVAGATNTTGHIRGLEAGSNITLTENGSNIVVASTGGGGVAFSDLVWTNNGTQILPNAFPTNVMLRVNVPDDGVGTNFYFDSVVQRRNAATKLFTIRNGGSNALTVGPFGGLSLGSANPVPFANRIFDSRMNTVAGDPQQSIFFMRNTHSGVGYLGSIQLTTTTNSSSRSTVANSASGQQASSTEAVSFTNATLEMLIDDGFGAGTRGIRLSPGISTWYPTNYIFNSLNDLTNTHTILSLQNSNHPMFEVDGIGDLRLLKRVAYSWPSSQGAAGTALTNDGAGNLGWGTVSGGPGGSGLTTNANQFGASVQLTIKDGALVTNLVTYGGSPALTVIPAASGNSNAFQVMNQAGSRVVYVETNDLFTASNTFIRGHVNDLIPRTLSYTYDNLAAPSNAVSTWASNSTVAASGWVSICWAPELSIFCAVSYSGANRVMTSSNGVDWVLRSAAAANSWLSVCWSPELRLFCAVSSDGTDRIMTSPDGINWTSRTAPEANFWRAVTWSPELRLFVAVANVLIGTQQVMTSADGINWFGQTASEDGQWVSIAWSPELRLFAVGGVDGVNRMMTSPDGTNWTSRASATSEDWLNICWSPELRLFCAVGDTSNSGGLNRRVQTSPDGKTWTSRIPPVTNDWRTVTWSPELGIFLATGFALSPTSARSAIASKDGITWETYDLPEIANFNDICWSPELGMFCAVNDSATHRVITSTVIPTTRSIAFIRKLAENRVGNMFGAATNLSAYGSVSTPAITTTALVGSRTNLTEWRGTNGALGLSISSNGLALIQQRLDLANSIAFRTNQVDFRLNTYQAFNTALVTNLVLQLTNALEGVTTRLDAYGNGRLGGGRTNAWQLLCTVPAGFFIYWPPGTTNGNYDVLVNSNQVVSFTFMGGLGSTNILASYRVLEGIGAN